MNRILKTILFLLTVLTLAQSCRVTHKSSDLFQNKESEQFYKQAQSYQFKGNLDSALICFDKADKSAPNTAVILHERGLLKSSMKMYDSALIDLNQSIELTTDQRQKEIRISNRALTYMKMGNMTEACNDSKNSGKWGKGYIEKYCK